MSKIRTGTGREMVREDATTLRGRLSDAAAAAARAFFRENQGNPWILIAGADLRYEFREALHALRLRNAAGSDETVPLFEVFTDRFNLELRRMIIEQKDSEIALLQESVRQQYP